MRYYDKIETPKTGKTFTEIGENRLSQSDSKVQNWFRPLPEGYKRAFDIDGFPINILIPVPTQAEKEAKENEQALESQNQTIISHVKSAEYHFIPGSRHPDTAGKWQEWVDKLWVIYDSAEVQELPEKPF